MKCLGKLSIFALYLALTTIAFTALAEDGFEGIEVFGEASIEIDELPVLQISIVEQGVTAYKTSLLVKQKTTQIINGLLASGINQQEIQTTAIQINTIDDRQSVNIDQVEVFKNVNGQPLKVNTKTNPKKYKTKRSFFIEASSDLLIELKEPGSFEHLYDVLLKYGAADIRQVEPVGDVESYYSQALLQALNNARSKAQDLTLRMNSTLGDIVSIEELATPSISADMCANARHAVKGHALKKSTVSAEVKVRFEVK